MADERDWNRYHLVSDREADAEHRRSLAIAHALTQSTGRCRPLSAASYKKYQAPASPARPRSAASPMRQSMGGASPLARSQTAGPTRTGGGTIGIAASPSPSRLLARSSPQLHQQHQQHQPSPHRYDRQQPPPYRSVDFDAPPPPLRHSAAPGIAGEGTLGATRYPDSPVTLTLGTLRSKYEENLGVIDQLYEEKRALEARVRSLDHQARHPHSRALLPGAEDLRRSGRHSAAFFDSSASPSPSASTTLPPRDPQRSGEYPGTGTRTVIADPAAGAYTATATAPGRPMSADRASLRQSWAPSPTAAQTRDAATGPPVVRQSRDLSPAGRSHMSPVATVMEALKLKHEQNIEVIERLHREKRSLESKARSLEMQILHGTSPGDDRAQHKARRFHVEGHDLEADGEGGDDRHYSEEQKGDDGHVQRRPTSNYGSSSNNVRGSRGVGLPRGGVRGSRSLSADSWRSGSFDISPQLQADQERYLQRIHESKRREEERRREQKLHEDAVAERFLKAAQRTKDEEFIGLKRRDEMSEVRAEARKERLKAHEENQRREREEKERRDKERRLAEGLERKEREKREKAQREELLASVSSFEPRKGSDGSARRLAKEKHYPDVYNPQEPKPFTAEDPAAVLEKLSRKQEAFEQQLERTKQFNEDQKKLRLAAEAHNAVAVTKKVADETFHGTEGMVERAAAAKAKAMEKERSRKEAEDKAMQQKLEEDRRNKEKWLNAKPPEEGRKVARPDVLSARQEEAREKEKFDELEAKKNKARRALQQMIAAEVAFNDKSRKDKLGTFVELSAADEIAAERRRKNQEEYRRNLRENRAKYKAVQDARPSLMQRHDMDTAKVKGGSAALSKVAQAVQAVYGDAPAATKGKKGAATKRSAFDDDDLFDEDERIQLGFSDHHAEEKN